MQIDKLDKLRLLSVILVAFALLFLCISVPTNSWRVNQDLEGVVSSELGLWKICYYEEGATGEPCASLESNKAKGSAVFIFTIYLIATKNRYVK